MCQIINAMLDTSGQESGNACILGHHANLLTTVNETLYMAAVSDTAQEWGDRYTQLSTKDMLR